MSNWIVHLALFVVALIYGATYSIAKLVIPDFVPPAAMILLRVSGATLLFILLGFVLKKDPIQNFRDYTRLAICGFFGIAANQLLFFEGLALTTPINASLIMTTTPILVLLISAFIIKERITWLKITGIMLGLSGAVMLIGGTDFQFSHQGAWGDFMIWINALFYGIYLVLVKPLMQRYEALTVVRWCFIFGLLFVLPFGLPPIQSVVWSAFPMHIVFSIVFLILFTTFIAYLLNAWTLRYVSASIVGFYIYLQPLLATFIAIAMGQDELSWQTFFYSILIFTGVFLVSFRK
ncbi:MAG: DMT family transporter [Bernardetiaceae bacterium]|nr:DMT family transporter [Bernardetiaceae bacterium]